ncbi:MAG TPA: hypothetical protein VEV65_09980, partial [Kineosporiaceae bacterium]|nr:hypothetical protein [Kineosporiaceae bacterium]
MTSVRGVRRWQGRLAVLTGVVVLPVAGLTAAVDASADTRPSSSSTPATVSADALPTVQIDGVVWSQAIVGTTVYAGGKFTTARPAGAAPGTQTVKRGNLLAYDIRTGALRTTFAPTLNGQVLSVVASPDGKRVYVGGEFTTANGQRRNRLAAYDTATGKLVTTFAPSLDQRVRAIVATSTRVYVGGAFSTANGLRRTRIAAFAASNGGLLSWAPRADDGQVLSMVLAPGGTRIVVGGQFTKLSGKANRGLGAIDAVTAVVGSFAVNTVVKDSGLNAGITSLTTDGRLVYGTGYDFGGGNFEGTFAATAAGALTWLEDCHGDTYSSAPVGPVIYTVSHAHSCTTLGAFPDVTPKAWHRALAFTTAVKGTLSHWTAGHYADFGGRPAPRLLIWFPDLTAGSYTGQDQAAWSVVANSSYVALGGEFPAVNGKRQQGLVRFAISSLAPNKQGPMATPADLAVQATPTGAGAVRVTYRTTW